MAELLLFSQAAESMARALGPLLDARAREHLRELGVDYGRPLEPAYPLEVWRRVVDYAGELVAPGQPYDRQQFALGGRFITAYTETVIGRAMLALTRLLGPRRTIERMAKTLRSGNNYSQTRVTQIGPTTFDLWCNHVQNPSFYRGMFETGLLHTGVAGVRVTTAAIDRAPADRVAAEETSATFRITW